VQLTHLSEVTELCLHRVICTNEYVLVYTQIAIVHSQFSKIHKHYTYIVSALLFNLFTELMYSIPIHNVDFSGLTIECPK